jgi:hypothetical protein
MIDNIAEHAMYPVVNDESGFESIQALLLPCGDGQESQVRLSF